MESLNSPADNPWTSSWKKDLVSALFVVLVSSALFAIISKQWLYPARIPRVYSNDYLVYLTWVETMIEQGSYLKNTRVAMPHGTDWRGFPTSDGWLNWQIIRVLAFVNPEPTWVMNWFYWLTFPLVGLNAFIVARLLGISRATAISLALLYDFMPYHFLRDEHVFMTAYYLVPWSIYACMFWRQTNPAIGERNLATLLYFFLAILTGAGYVYYAYFACLLMVFAGIYRSVNDRDNKPAMYAVFWCATVFGTLMLTMTPEILYKRNTPPNPDTTTRVPSEADEFGFRIPQLVLPIPDHRIDRLATYREYYQEVTKGINENETSPLGMIGAVGLIVIFFRFFFHRRGVGESANDLPALLGTLIVMLGIVGGFSSLINWIEWILKINPWIRSVNRISIFLSFVVLFVLAEIADKRLSSIKGPIGKTGFLFLLAILTAFGIYDQTPRGISAKYARNAEKFASDEEFYPKIEKMGAPANFIFVMGYRFYPECAIPPLIDYSMFRPFLHAKSVNISYGALRGDANDLWSRELSHRPLPEILDQLARMEALGLLIYRLSLKDNGKELEAQARQLLGIEPIVSNDGEFAFFPLKKYSEKLKSQGTPDAWADMKARLQNPLTPIWRKNFQIDTTAGDPKLMAREFNTFAEVRIQNRLDQTRQLRLKFTVEPMQPDSPMAPRWLRVSQGEIGETYPVATTGTVIERVIQVPPGETVVVFSPSPDRESLEAGNPPRTAMYMSEMSWSEVFGK